ncbi:hypothetical protein PPERSA_10490 [Pseudocohnilembus persalinus]|uniref:ATP-dependent helicase C-terminal domain-containing protein n=1 Tax=Pseudocohnilembus persalinus TaxID=266149 RepID=A0A0V0R7C0_PSEPJ|nr:hypothetical protein PPERSA_10490 [Pseudocohnilembus persalinus]|eukprot:KRX10391.1 hypothetical protein PPERSA_10490 [Pseudocohnilembus persalinus]
MPYNYLLNPNKMPKFQIDLENAVVIFDEAHNVAEVSEDGFSFQLEDLYLESAIEELKTLKKVIKRNDIMMAIDFTEQLQEMMGKLANGKNFIKKTNNQQDTYVKDGREIFTIIKEHVRIRNFESKSNMKNFYHFNPKKINQKKVRKSIQTTMKEESKQQSLMSYGFNKVQGQKSEEKNEQKLNLDNFNKIINIFNEAQIYLMMSKDWGVDNVLMFLSGVRNLMSSDEQFQDEKQKKSTKNTVTHFKLVFKKDHEKKNNQLQMMCLDPSLSFQKIIQKNPYNIMLTSGTLTPFNFWDEELKIDFDIKLSGKHVIDTKNNLSAGIVHRGPSGIEFDFSFRNRENDQMFVDLGLLIKDLSSQIPGGILVIFSSYSIRDKCKQLWLKNDIYLKINVIKQIMIEMSGSEESKSVMNSYKQKCNTKDGAILLAVSKGKLSEGYDFPDDLCRAVIVVGIPFPPIMETKVEQKRKYLDEISGKIRGQDWYLMQAMRATNQALGRVVRHREDFGQILMLDSRFKRADLKNQISGWVRENLKSWYSAAEVVRESQNFFKNQEVLQIQRVEEAGLQRQLQQVLERDQALIQVQRAKRLGMEEEQEIQKPFEQLKDTEKPAIQNEQASEIEKMKLADRIQLIMEFNKIKNSDKKVGSNASRLLEIQQQQESEKKLKEEQEQQQQCNNLQNPQEEQQIQQAQQKQNVEYLPTIFKKQQERMEQLKKEQEEFFKQKMEEQKKNQQYQNQIENKHNSHQNQFNLTQDQNQNINKINQNQIFTQQHNFQDNLQNPLYMENFSKDVVIKPPVSTIQNFNNQGINLKNLDQQQKVDISNSLYRIMNNEDLAWKNVQDQNKFQKQRIQNREQQSDEQLQNNQLLIQQQKLQDRKNNNNASKLIKKTFKFHFQQDESMPSSQNTTNIKQNQQQNFDLFSKKGTKRKNSLQEENHQNSNDNYNYKKNKTPDKNSYLDGQFENQKKVLNFDDLKQGVTQEGKIRLLNQNKLDQAMKKTFGDYQNQGNININNKNKNKKLMNLDDGSNKTFAKQLEKLEKAYNEKIKKEGYQNNMDEEVKENRENGNIQDLNQNQKDFGIEDLFTSDNSNNVLFKAEQKLSSPQKNKQKQCFKEIKM